MNLGPGALKLLGGMGTLLLCGAAGTAVALDARPADAPLRPPVDPAAPLNAAAVAPAPGDTVVIPSTPSCSGVAAAPSAQSQPGPALQPILGKLEAAGPAQRRSILAGLPADQRLQVVAYLRARAAAASCRDAATASSSGAAALAPSVVDVPGSAAPLVVSSVS